MTTSRENPAATTSTDYWACSSRPLVGLFFVAPMLVAYEGGLLLLGPQAMRNGADAWLRHGLEQLGFGQYFLLPLLTCGVLLAWHHLQRESWHVSVPLLPGMLLESVVLSLVLLLLAHLQGSLLAFVGAVPCSVPAGEGASPGQFVAFLGAGIYEELLFRLMLLPLVAVVLKAAGATPRTSLIGAVVATSMLFAAAHYRFEFSLGTIAFATVLGEPFEWTSFLFRSAAGVFFSLVFLYRGFGIAAGTHAFYDILVSLL